jgi:hypothetical protein
MRVDTIPVNPLGIQAPGWIYMPVHDVEPMGTESDVALRILCEDDQGGPMVSVPCFRSDLPLLEPYLALIDAWRESPLEIETPVIPVYFGQAGAPCVYLPPPLMCLDLS